MIVIKIDICKDEVVQLAAFLNTCMMASNLAGIPGADAAGGVMWKVINAARRNSKNSMITIEFPEWFYICVSLWMFVFMIDRIIEIVKYILRRQKERQFQVRILKAIKINTEEKINNTNVQ